MRRPRPEVVESVAAGSAVAASIALLLLRVVPDVRRKPIFVDEVVAGLTATRPFDELVGIVVSDRGGAPAHFVLVHLAFLFHSSVDVLRWLSVLCAAATVAVTYDLARRLHGRLAGVGAAVVVATSPLLGVYGSFGRMYALFALAGALAADLLVRALEQRTTGSAVAAGVAVAALPLVHPYGVVPAALVAATVAFRWRSRPVALALLGGGAALVAVPVALAALRLSDRFGVARNDNSRLLSPDETLEYVWRTVGDFAGTRGAAVLVPVLLALAGAVALRSSRRTFVLVGLLALVLPFVLLSVLPTGRPQGLANVSTRHMIFVLPVWAALIGAGGAALLGRLPRPLTLGAGAVLAAFLAYFGSLGIADPRTSSELNQLTGRRAVLAEPARWLGERTAARDLLYFGSPLYLEALPATRDAHLLDAAPGGILGRTLDRVDFPVPGAVVAIPTGRAEIELGPLAALGEADVYASERWLVIRALGPLANAREALTRLHEAWLAGMNSVPTPSRRLRAHLRDNEANLCGALRRRGGNCQP
jgi:hypothetical protein